MAGGRAQPASAPPSPPRWPAGIARVEGFCPTATGKPRWWELSFARYERPVGEEAQVICISRDVTERYTAVSNR